MRSVSGEMHSATAARSDVPRGQVEGGLPDHADLDVGSASPLPPPPMSGTVAASSHTVARNPAELADRRDPPKLATTEPATAGRAAQRRRPTRRMARCRPASSAVLRLELYYLAHQPLDGRM